MKSINYSMSISWKEKTLEYSVKGVESFNSDYIVQGMEKIEGKELFSFEDKALKMLKKISNESNIYNFSIELTVCKDFTENVYNNKYFHDWDENFKKYYIKDKYNSYLEEIKINSKKEIIKTFKTDLKEIREYIKEEIKQEMYSKIEK